MSEVGTIPDDRCSRGLDFNLRFLRKLSLAVDNAAPVVIFNCRFQTLSAFDVFGAHLNVGEQKRSALVLKIKIHNRPSTRVKQKQPDEPEAVILLLA